MNDVLEKVRTYRWWAILKALPFEGGPSSTKWVYLAMNAVLALIPLALTAAICYVYVRTMNHHVDGGLLAALVTIVGIISTCATTALNYRHKLNAQVATGDTPIAGPPSPIGIPQQSSEPSVRASVVALMLAFVLAATAQAQVTVTANSCIATAGNQLIAKGKFEVRLTDGNDNPIFVSFGGRQILSEAIRRDITVGGIPNFQLPTPTDSVPQNYFARVTVTNTTTNKVTTYKRVTVNPVSGVWDWCTANLNQSFAAAPTVPIVGPQGQPGCNNSASDCTVLVSTSPSGDQAIVMPAGKKLSLNNTVIDGVISLTAMGGDKSGLASSSSAVLAARNALMATGGTVVVPGGTYKWGVDLSSCNAPAAPVVFVGWGATIIPDGSTDFLVKIDNSACPGGYVGSNIKFVGFSFWGQSAPSGTLTPTIDNLIYLKGTQIESENNRYSSCMSGCLYGYYAQYTRSTDDTFSSGKTAGAKGAWFTGGSAASASNELVFIRPRFNTNTEAARAQGVFSPMFLKPQVQNNTHGIILDSDASGQSTTGTVITGFYSELNSGPVIEIGTAQRTTIIGGAVLDMASVEPLWLYSSTTYGLSVSGVNSFGAGASINHPSTNVDTASLTWSNNNMLPTLGLTHPGPTELSIKTSGGDSTEQIAGNYIVTASGNASIVAQTIALRATNGSGTVGFGLNNSNYLYKFNSVVTQMADRFINMPDANVDLTPLGVDLTGTGCNTVLIDSANHFHRGVTTTGC